jgi:hypothetical protein
MNTKSALLVAATAVFGACGGQPDTPAPAPTPLAYTVPAMNPVTYSSQDTARINIEVQPGMGMEQTMGQNSTVRLSFAPSATGSDLAVTATWVDFSAFVESAMMPRQEIGADALRGEFLLTLSPEGDVDQVSGPDLPEEVEGMTMGDNMFADFFLRLPNRLVQPGETWTDTVHAEHETEGARSVNETIVNSTFAGDTTVAGRTLWRINSTKTTSVLVEGTMQGMDMRNELSGTITETALWDPARRILHSSSSRGSMTGLVSIPNAGMTDIPISVSNTRSIRLVETTQED